MDSKTVITLADVGKRYGSQAVLSGIDLEVGAGECLALLGHNGAGKTTLMKLMLGLTRPNSGRISVLGETPGDGTRTAIGYLPENVAFHDAMTGRELLRFYAALKGVAAKAGDNLLERVGLTAAAGKRVRTYSKGMRQRLGLAQALLGTPRLLFFDEPTSGLDPALRWEFYAILAELRALGNTVLISSHLLTELETRCDRLAILSHGRLVACGSLDELRAAAGLPLQIRVSVTPGEAGAVAERIAGPCSLRKVNDRSVVLTCAGSDKMQLMHHIAGLGGPVRDVEFTPPGLEEVYKHFSEPPERSARDGSGS